MRTVLYVCTGNTCRSPMAEAITRHWIDQGELGDPAELFVASAGVAPLEGAPISPEAVRALAGLGIRHEGRAKPLTADMTRKADIVLCMTAEHLEVARALVSDDPQQMAKVMILDPQGDIADPVGRGQEAYNRLARRLLRSIPARWQEVMVE